MVDNTRAWGLRGGSYGDRSSSGIFSLGTDTGLASSSGSFRIIIANYN